MAAWLTQRIVTDGEEFGMTDGGYLEVKSELGDVKLSGGELTCTVSLRETYYVHDHGPLGKHRHSLLDGGRLGPAKCVCEAGVVSG